MRDMAGQFKSKDEFVKWKTDIIASVSRMVSMTARALGLHVCYQIVYHKIQKGEEVNLLDMMDYSFSRLMREYRKACTGFKPLISKHGSHAEYCFGDMIGKIHAARRRLLRDRDELNKMQQITLEA
jgi:hypothetical protein